MNKIKIFNILQDKGLYKDIIDLIINYDAFCGDIYYDVLEQNKDDKHGIFRIRYYNIYNIWKDKIKYLYYCHYCDNIYYSLQAHLSTKHHDNNFFLACEDGIGNIDYNEEIKQIIHILKLKFGYKWNCEHIKLINIEHISDNHFLQLN